MYSSVLMYCFVIKSRSLFSCVLEIIACIVSSALTACKGRNVYSLFTLQSYTHTFTGLGVVTVNNNILLLQLPGLDRGLKCG